MAINFVEESIPTTGGSLVIRDFAWSPSLTLFVAVGARTSGLNRFMSSPDGITWTLRNAPEANFYRGVAWSPTLSLFVAVSSSGTNRVATSSDGTNWTAVAAASASGWQSVVWADTLNLFVAVGSAGAVMTSPNGTTWTTRTGIVKSWVGIAWSSTLTLLVAVAGTAGTASVMTSPDGVNWTGQTTPSVSFFGPSTGSSIVSWSSPLGMFAAVARTDSPSSGDYQVLTSTNGTSWTARTMPTSPSDYRGGGLMWAGNQFISVEEQDSYVSSTDGVNWTRTSITPFRVWDACCYSPDLDVAVVFDQSAHDVMLYGHPVAVSALSITSISPALGVASGGTNVTITGTSFAAGMIVNIGGTACTNVVVVDSATITCTTGAHVVGLYDVTVTLPTFVYATLTSGFTYITDFSSASAFILTSSGSGGYASGHGPMAGGTLVTITGTFFAVGVVVLFDGIPGTSVLVPNSTTVTCLTPPHQVGAVNVTIGSFTLAGGFTYDPYTVTSWPIPSNIQYAPAMRIEDVLNDSPNTCTFRGINVEPTVGKDVQFDFSDGFGLLFAGTIQTVEQVFQGKPTSLAWDVTVIDYTWMLNRRIPFGSWDNISLSTIVLELVANFSTGFSVANVQAGLPPISITLNGSKNFATCLTDMSQLSSPACKWYVDYRKVINFFST